MTGFLSPSHILLLLVVVLLLLGAKRLPEFGRSLGSRMHEFRHSLDNEAGVAPQLTSVSAPESDTGTAAAREAGTKRDTQFRAGTFRFCAAGRRLKAGTLLA